MRKNLCTLTLCLLALTASAAGASALQPQSTPAADLQPLLLEIDERLAVGAPMLIEVFVDGNLVHTEEAVTLGAEGDEGAFALPILASSPDAQESFVTMTEARSSQVVVRVTSADQVLADLDLSQIASDSQGLLSNGSRIVGLRFDASLARGETPPQNGGNCELQCELQWYQCLNQAGCEIPLQGEGDRGLTTGAPELRPSCGQCNSQYFSCVNNCEPPPPVCPTTTTQTSTAFLGYTWLGGFECYEWIFDGAYFVFSRANYQVTTTTTTNNCDGTTSTTTTVTYPFSYCYLYQGGFCSFPFIGPPGAVCF